MLVLDNIILDTTIQEVFLKLKKDIDTKGIKLISNYKISTDNIQFCCIAHNNGQEKKPSAGMRITKKGNIDEGTVHCFACGYKATLLEFISNVFGRNDLGMYGLKWLSTNFMDYSVDTRSTIELDFSRKTTVKKNKYISDDILDNYRYIHPYMYKRKLTNGLIQKYDVGYDDSFMLRNKKDEYLTFPVRDIHGNVLFIVRRSINRKLFHYPKDVEKPVYGVYEWDKQDKTVVICESILNALTCVKYGFSAFALLGLGTANQFNYLKTLNIRKFILGFDGDDAGNKASYLFAKTFNKSHIVTRLVLPNNKDINDLENIDFLNLPEIFL